LAPEPSTSKAFKAAAAAASVVFGNELLDGSLSHSWELSVDTLATFTQKRPAEANNRWQKVASVPNTLTFLQKRNTTPSEYLIFLCY